MELRHYWRVLVRRGRIVLITFAIVTIISLALVGLSTYGSINITQMSIVVVQRAATLGQLHGAVPGLAQVPYDADRETQDLSVVVVNNAFSATDRRSYFERVSQTLKDKYGINQRWDQLQAKLDIYPAARNIIFFKVSGAPGENNTNAKIVQTAAQWVITYIETQYPALYHPINAPTATVNDPVNVRQEHIISKHLSEVLLRLIGGLVLGLVLAFLWEYLDEYVQDEHDVEALLGTRALAVIPGPGHP